MPDTPLAQRYGFVSADLNKTERADFIVAAYSDPWGFSGAVRVLKKGSGEMASEFSFDCCAGFNPEISMIDLDHSGRPGILVEFGTDRGAAIDWLFRWSGAALVPISPTEPVLGGTALRNADFIDLDGDGILEIVDHTDVSKYSDVLNTYNVYKLINGAYTLSGTFEYYSIGFSPGGPPPFRSRVEAFVASKPKAPYAMTIVNGDGRDHPPVQGAEILLNGEPVTTPGQITQSVRSLKIPVTVKAKNTVDVKVSGSQGAMLYIGIGPAEPPKPPPADSANSKQ